MHRCMAETAKRAHTSAALYPLQVGNSAIVRIVSLIVHDKLIVNKVETIGPGFVRGRDHLLD